MRRAALRGALGLRVLAASGCGDVRAPVARRKPRVVSLRVVDVDEAGP